MHIIDLLLDRHGEEVVMPSNLEIGQEEFLKKWSAFEAKYNKNRASDKIPTSLPDDFNKIWPMYAAQKTFSWLELALLALQKWNGEEDLDPNTQTILRSLFTIAQLMFSKISTTAVANVASSETPYLDYQTLNSSNKAVRLSNRIAFFQTAAGMRTNFDLDTARKVAEGEAPLAEQALKMLKEYTQNGSALKRFVSGHRDRKYCKQIQLLINRIEHRKEITSFNAIVAAVNKIGNINPSADDDLKTANTNLSDDDDLKAIKANLTLLDTTYARECIEQSYQAPITTLELQKKSVQFQKRLAYLEKKFPQEKYPRISDLIIAMMQDYTKNGRGFIRFITGNWEHHHCSELQKIIDDAKKGKKTAIDLKTALNLIDLENPCGHVAAIIARAETLTAPNPAPVLTVEKIDTADNRSSQTMIPV